MALVALVALPSAAAAPSAALEDALYYLDRALSRGAIDIESFLREVRSLARRQFLAKAHLQKLAALG